jgi:hypothetical protein
MTHIEAIEEALRREQHLRDSGKPFSTGLIDNLSRMLDSGDVQLYEHMENCL